VRVIVALIFIVTAFFAFEYWLLRPVALISRALKIEANGFQIETLPTANTLEARELIEAFEEMRKQVRIRQMELEHQAMHDGLTGLPNRILLRKMLDEAIKYAKESKTELALLMIDLDRFKEINDTLGHHMGDRVLREIGPRFRRELGKQDFLARLGGDEFAVLLTDTDAEKVNDLAVRLSKTLDADFYLDGQKLWVGSSIGIALYPQHGINEQALLQRADVAMYLAKHKNLRYAVYDESQDEHSVWQLSFESELHQVIDSNELVLNYQPKIDLASGVIYGVEALLRWHHKQHGLIPADEVHLLAEKTGLIKPLTEWVIRTVIEQLSNWSKQGIDLSISANLSVWNLQDPKLFGVVNELLRQFDVPANRLILEITESAVMSDPDSAMDTMNKLSELGVQLSIDDFGVGFSSLQYLKKLPVKELKIDKTFVLDMVVDENDALIVRSTIELAHNLGLSVIAEGVESEEVINLLKLWGCDSCQGFHISHAITLDELDDWLKVSAWGLKDKSRLKLIN
jgi:diguanylate cyclase (GGDEF)-like protein